MSYVVYLRGSPGTGKNTVARLLERDLKIPRLWVHHLDPLFRVLGEYRLPKLTDKLLREVAAQLCEWGRDFIFVRPSRDSESVFSIRDLLLRHYPHYVFIPVRLTASYDTLVTRVTRRWSESPFRLTTQAALDEYLQARPESAFPGEHVIDTDDLTPEQVAANVKELLGESKCFSSK